MSDQRDPKQTQELLAAYGGAMLYAHLIEDMLKLHLGNCKHARVNGYDRRTISELNRMSHEQRINELPVIYGLENKRIMGRVKTTLHQLRKIRNLLSHDFFIQVGKSMATQEGIDQLVAMLNRIIKFEAEMLEGIQNQNTELIESTSDIRFDEPSKIGSATYLTKVESSRLQQILCDLENEIG